MTFQPQKHCKECIIKLEKLYAVTLIDGIQIFLFYNNNVCFIIPLVFHMYLVVMHYPVLFCLHAYIVQLTGNPVYFAKFVSLRE